MVSLDRITDKFEQLEAFLSILDVIKHTQLATFLKNKMLIGGAKYYLQVSIECCLDIANHIIAAEGFRAPRDYADSFKVLMEVNVLNEDLGTKLMQMAKFRNRLVHLYGEIDDAYVHSFIKNDMQDILDFKNIVVDQYFR